MKLRNVDIHPLKGTPPFRKIALGTWGYPGDPQIYGTLEIDLTRANEWREAQPRGESKITVTAMVTKALALAMKRYPDLNGFIRFRKIFLRKSVDISCLVAVKHDSGQEDLTSVRLEGVDRMSVQEIADRMSGKVGRVRGKGDSPAQESTKILSKLPGFLVHPVLELTSFLSYSLNLSLPGLPPDLFGGVLVTNVGVFGLDVAYAPLVPYSKVPVIVLLGEAKKRPVVVGDQVEVREVVTLNATIDHRFCDGALVGKMVRVIKEAFERPEDHF